MRIVLQLMWAFIEIRTSNQSLMETHLCHAKRGKTLHFKLTVWPYLLRGNGVNTSAGSSLIATCLRFTTSWSWTVSSRLTWTTRWCLRSKLTSTLSTSPLKETRLIISPMKRKEHSDCTSLCFLSSPLCLPMLSSAVWSTKGFSRWVTPPFSSLS